MGSAALLMQSSQDIPSEALELRDRKAVIGSQALERFDITEGKEGITLTLILAIVDAENGFRPIRGAHVELWHCDADGVYSQYANEINPQSVTTTYLRGTQATDHAGRVTFRTIYPGWCRSRATHVNVGIFEGGRPQGTVQLGFPDVINAAVYRDVERYVRGQNPTRNAADPVFGSTHRDESDRRFAFQIAPVAGDNASGYVAMLEIPVKRFRLASVP